MFTAVWLVFRVFQIASFLMTGESPAGVGIYVKLPALEFAFSMRRARFLLGASRRGACAR